MQTFSPACTRACASRVAPCFPTLPLYMQLPYSTLYGTYPALKKLRTLLINSLCRAVVAAAGGALREAARADASARACRPCPRGGLSGDPACIPDGTRHGEQLVADSACKHSLTFLCAYAPHTGCGSWHACSCYCTGSGRSSHVYGKSTGKPRRNSNCARHGELHVASVIPCVCSYLQGCRFPYQSAQSSLQAPVLAKKVPAVTVGVSLHLHAARGLVTSRYITSCAVRVGATPRAKGSSTYEQCLGLLSSCLFACTVKNS